jgi:hypothetical protein
MPTTIAWIPESVEISLEKGMLTTIQTLAATGMPMTAGIPTKVEIPTSAGTPETLETPVAEQT